MKTRPVGWIIALAGSLSCGDVVRPTDNPPAVASITIVASQTWLPLQQSLQLSAVLTDDQGDTLKRIPIGWSSSHPDVATVNADGRLLGFTAGLTRVVATAGDVSDTLVFSVDADGPASEETWTCADSFLPSPPIARRLAFEVEAPATNPYVSTGDFLLPLLVNRGASVIHQYENFPLVSVMLDRDSIAAVRADFFNATARTGPFLRGLKNPDEAQGRIVVQFTDDSAPITAEILRLGGLVIEILSVTPVIIASVPDSAVPYVQSAANVVELEYNWSACQGL